MTQMWVETVLLFFPLIYQKSCEKWPFCDVTKCPHASFFHCPVFLHINKWISYSPDSWKTAFRQEAANRGVFQRALLFPGVHWPSVVKLRYSESLSSSRNVFVLGVFGVKLTFSPLCRSDRQNSQLHLCCRLSDLRPQNGKPPTLSVFYSALVWHGHIKKQKLHFPPYFVKSMQRVCSTAADFAATVTSAASGDLSQSICAAALDLTSTRSGARSICRGFLSAQTYAEHAGPLMQMN